MAINRRQMLQRTAAGFGGLALSWMLQQRKLGAAGPQALPRRPVPNLPPRAKSCIFLFMSGGPSQVDLFDPKPLLKKLHGQRLPKSFGSVETQFIRETDVVMASRREFRPHGQSGIEISDFLPHTSTVADELAVIRSCYCDSFIHESAQYQLSTGRVVSGFPSLGSWVTYGLGSEAEDLPSYVVLPSKDGVTEGGKPVFGSGFLPVANSGVVLRNGQSPILDLLPGKGHDGAHYRKSIDAIRQMNEATASPGDAELAARIASYEMAFRMQATAPEAVDISRESKATLEMYGVGKDPTDDFGRRCLLARRMVERGVRFVLVFGGGGDPQTQQWDAHADLEDNHGRMCGATDQPTAALIKDLKQRGLLDETLVLWGGEFGRTPLAEGKGGGKGRDHNPSGYSMWLAGGGVKGGSVVGATDELGLRAVENRCHIHAVHATILHQMGIDYEEQTFLSNGREERLTDVGGRLIREII
jgi:hypothetical protein